MAKNSQKTKSQDKPVDLGSTTYSTRFDDRQRDLIVEAAAMLNWSPAKLIREAAVRRAADVVNSEGPAESRLRAIAVEVAQCLIDPLVTGEFTQRERGEIISRERMTMGFREAMGRLSTVDDGDHLTWEVDNLSPTAMSGKRIAEIRAAMHSSGTRFLELVLQEWDAKLLGTDAYKPKVSADELLKGSKEEEL